MLNLSMDSEHPESQDPSPRQLSAITPQEPEAAHGLQPTAQKKTLQPSAAFVAEIQGPTQPAPTADSSNTAVPTAVAPPAIDTVSLYPQATKGVVADATPPPPPSDTPVPMRGSEKLPVGIYVIAAFLMLGFITSFLGSVHSVLVTIFTLIDVLLAVGLLLRKEMVRIILVIFSVITIVLSGISLIGLAVVQHREHQLLAKTTTILKNAETNPIASAEQQQIVEHYQITIANEQKQVDKTYTLAYVRIIVIICANGALVIYLGRPQIKSLFE